VFDRVTGKPLFPIEEHTFPVSTVPGEVYEQDTAHPTRPRALRPPTAYRRYADTRTPEAHQWALEQFKTFRSGGQFIPFSVDKQTVVFPGFDGGRGSGADQRSIPAPA